eukprot:COSAG05_NODE_1465_length_4804_cov_372.506270_6_plen_46_part_00
MSGALLSGLHDQIEGSFLEGGGGEAAGNTSSSSSSQAGGGCCYGK